MKLQNIINKSCIRAPLYLGLVASALAGEPQYLPFPKEPEAIIQTWSNPGRVKSYERKIRFPLDLPLDEYKRLVTAELAPLSRDVVQSSEEYHTLILWLAEKAKNSRGFFRDAQVNPLIAKFNAYQELADFINSRNFPEGFKQTLKTYFRPEVMTASYISVEEAYQRLADSQKKINTIPHECSFHRVEPGERLEAILPRYYPDFPNMDALKARNMLDSLAGFNPGLEKLGAIEVGNQIGEQLFGPMAKGKTGITVSERGTRITYYYGVVPGSTIAFPSDQRLLAAH